MSQEDYQVAMSKRDLLMERRERRFRIACVILAAIVALVLAAWRAA